MRKAAIGIVFAAALGAAACASYDDYGYGHGRYGGYDYVGNHYDRIGNGCGFFSGSGGDLLDPWLACTEEGQGIVRRMFDRGQNRRIGADTDRDMRLTDPEVRAALVNAERYAGR